MNQYQQSNQPQYNQPQYTQHHYNQQQYQNYNQQPQQYPQYIQMAPIYYANQPNLAEQKNYETNQTRQIVYPNNQNLQVQRPSGALMVRLVYNPNYQFNVGKLIAFLILLGIDLGFWIYYYSLCNKYFYYTCPIIIDILVYQAVCGVVYLTINIVLYNMDRTNLGCYNLYLFSPQGANGCDCCMGVLIGLFYPLWSIVTFFAFLVFLSTRKTPRNNDNLMPLDS